MDYTGISDGNAKNNIFDYNDYYRPNGGNIASLNYGGSPPTVLANLANLQSGWATYSSAYPNNDAHSISANPLFLSSSDYHLQSTSPAIDAGTDVGLTTDYDNKTVPSGPHPDIGAHEYQDTFAPTGGSFTINTNNPSYTNLDSVTLNITCPTDSWTPVQVAYGNTPKPNANWGNCTSGDITHSLTVGDGLKTIYVRFKDGGGNITDDYTHTITRDTQAPTITITEPDGSPAQSKTITASATESATLSYHIDNSGDDTCVDGLSFTNYDAPLTFTSESDNGKKVCYKAVDGATNASYSLSSAISGIDRTAPNTTIGNIHPNANSNSASGSFTFSSTEPTNATFKCKYDSGDYDFCTSPVTYSSFADGTRTFYVKAIDQAGNEDSSPAEFIWTIDTQAPTLQNLSPDGSIFPVTTTSATISVDTNETSTCRYSTTSGTAYASMNDLDTADGLIHTSLITGLNSGTTYTYYLKCQDPATNESGESTLSFSVAPEEQGLSLNTVKVKIGRMINKFKDTLHSKKKKIELKSEDSNVANGKVKIYADNEKLKTVSINSSGFWDYLLKLKDDADKIIKLKFFDQYGTLVNTKKAEIEVDTEDPEFTLFPPDGKIVYLHYTQDENRALVYQATDNEKIEKYKIEFNGKITDKKPISADRDKPQAFLVPQDTIPGSYLFKVTAYDEADNKAEKETTIAVRTSSGGVAGNPDFSQKISEVSQTPNQITQNADSNKSADDNIDNNPSSNNPTSNQTQVSGFRWWNPFSWF